MPKRRYIAVIVIVSLLGICIYYAFDPAQHLFPRCPFALLTGFRCPGCGTQRAIHQLLHLNIGEAFRYNALFVVSIPILLFMLITYKLRAKFPRLYKFSLSLPFSLTILIIIILWWVFRNIYNL